ncbi:hypothetical protein [Saccharothrix texasensis]|uniref:ClpA/ClpB-like protein n=1 Tax=Saccharothrix texasensis TaxID=103734 RepID=A0A3N1H4S7_9PSEU|nr:hypothetical protein [Saccharothrix texasensis]ROP37222.1 hypothetical protein EDD40_2521 [Saccharothrix texasensis]
MRIRTRLIAAVLAAGTLTALAASTSPALANPTTAVVEDKAKPDHGTPAKVKPEQGKPAKVRPDAGKPGQEKPGKGEGVPEEAVKLLAARLGITVDRSRQVFRDLEKVKARGDDILRDRAFVAIAEGLGLTPERLLEVLREVKRTLAEQQPKPTK